MLTIVNGVTSKQVLANEIINLLETMGLDGYFYLGYPVLGGIDGKIKVDALLVSEQTGIVLFDLETLAEENMEDKIQLLDELYNNMEAKLKRYGYLSKRRVLQVPINVLSYESRMLVYAYDELQSLDNKNVESPEDIFGYSNGRPNVVLDNSNGKAEDIVLSKCYRNSRPVLITAHSLGFGIYRKKEAREETSLVQLFEDKQLWEDIGYTVKEGVIRDGEFVTLYRTEETSPAFLEDHSSIDDLIQFRRFENNVQEADWIVEDIEKNLHDEELRYQDIMIIHPDPKITKSYVSHIRVKLMEKGIKSHIVGVQTTPDDFFQEDSIAISQIYRAKGNEAAVVYLINADLCARGINLSRKRNIIFTAMTRSKAWVRVSGIGDDMDLLIQEFNSVKERNFQLEFTYPDKSQRKNMRIIHRDMTQNELRDIRKSNSNLADITSKLANGEIRKEDLDEDTVNRLKDVLYN